MSCYNPEQVFFFFHIFRRKSTGSPCSWCSAATYWQVYRSDSALPLKSTSITLRCCRGATFRSTAAFSLNLAPPQRRTLLTPSRGKPPWSDGERKDSTRSAQRFLRPAPPDFNSLLSHASSRPVSARRINNTTELGVVYLYPSCIPFSSVPEGGGACQIYVHQYCFSFFFVVVVFPCDLHYDLSNIYFTFAIL